MGKFRSAYGERFRVSLAFNEPSLTEQHHKEECNINKILGRYDKTGLVTHTNGMKGTYEDFSEVSSYQESLNMVIRAQDDFLNMPSDIRKKFGNDPGEFMKFVVNPKNKEELEDMGLANKQEIIKETIQQVRIVKEEEGQTE